MWTKKMRQRILQEIRQENSYKKIGQEIEQKI